MNVELSQSTDRKIIASGTKPKEVKELGVSQIVQLVRQKYLKSREKGIPEWGGVKWSMWSPAKYLSRLSSRLTAQSAAVRCGRLIESRVTRSS